MKNIKLELKAVDFKGTEYKSNSNCAIAKALKRNGHEDVAVGAFNVDINEDEFHIKEGYSPSNFDYDKAKAASLLDDETVRIINLIKLS